MTANLKELVKLLRELGYRAIRDQRSSRIYLERLPPEGDDPTCKYCGHPLAAEQCERCGA